MYKACTPKKKNTTILILFCSLMFCHLFASAWQGSVLDKAVTLKLTNVSVQEALTAMEDQSGVRFSYSSTQLDVNKKVSVNFVSKRLKDALAELLGKQLKGLSVHGEQVTIQTFSGKGTIAGTIKTSDNQAAPFVTVGIKGVRTTQADVHGNYKLEDVEEGHYAITASYIGLNTQRRNISLNAGESLKVNFILTENSEELKEVEVNGRKKNKFVVNKSTTVAKLPLNRLENPQVYTSIPKALFEEQLTTDLTDVLKNTPGILKMQGSIGRSGDGAVYYNLRGFPTRISMIDGLAGQTNGDIDPAYVEKIEILKGPSGTLFGGALTTFGGVINVITKKPKDYFGGEIGYTTGNWNLNRLTADVYGPVTEDHRLKFRLNAAYHKRNSFQDAGFRKSMLVAPVITYDFNEKLNLMLSAEFYQYEGTNPSIVFLHRSRPYIATTPAELGYNWKRSFTSDDITLKAPASNIHAELNYKMDKNWTSRTSISRNVRNTDGIYQYQFIREQNRDNDVERNVQFQNYEGTSTAIQQNFTGDFKIAGLRNRLVIGLDYLNQTTYNNNSPIVKFDTVSAVISGKQLTKYGKLTRARALAKIAASTGDVVKNYNSSNIYSLYASNALNVTDRLLALFSLRVDRFESMGTKNLAVDTMVRDTRFMQTALSPKLGLVYQILKDQLSVFGNYMNSFSNVPPVTQPRSEVPGVFKPQQGNQLEAGIKTDLFEGRLSLTASYYDIKVKNVTRDEKMMIQGIEYNITVQDGTQRSKGFELELLASPIEGMNLIAGYSYNDSKLIKSTIALEGRRPVSAGPAQLLNAWLSYTMPQGNLKGLGMGLGANHASKFLSGNSTTTGVFTFPAYTQWNATAFYDAPKFRVGLKLDNLTNEQIFTGQGVISPQMPRSVTANVTLKF